MTYADDLLAQAGTLRDVDVRKPKQANLRRAISAAYYALFRQLIEDAVALLLPVRSELRFQLARKFVHKTMKNVAQATAKDASAPPDLVFVANAFVTLQEARHEADYDFSRLVTKAETTDHIARSRHAIAKWSVVAATPAGERFLLELLTNRLDT